jgi:hypothetical protein
MTVKPMEAAASSGEVSFSGELQLLAAAATLRLGHYGG